MKARDWAGALVVVAVVVGAAVWFFVKPDWFSTPAEPAAATGAASESIAEAAPDEVTPADESEPPPESVPEPDPAMAPESLPTLQESDVPVQQALIELFGPSAVESFLVPQALITRFVVMVDNLPAPSVPPKIRSLRKVDGDFGVTESDGHYYLNPSNSARYAGLVEAIQLADMKRCAAFYKRYYPLFQQAYEQIGYRNKSFNTRFVQVIDHLLATPEISGPIELVRPRAYYQFANPDLEDLSAGQKALLRLGAENADVVKFKLRELRSALAAH